MAKKWQGEVHIDAPVSEVYRYLADFSRHCEWDQSATRLEQVERGDAEGIGAQWRSYEKLDSLQSDQGRKPLLQLHGNVGVAVREVRELVPNQRIAWHTYPVPRMGVTADCAFDLVEENGGCKLTETVQINAPSVMESLGKFVFKSLDAKQAAQWEANLQAIRQAVETGATAKPPMAAAASS
jgi:hypothetical protein